jgi:1,2-diacylglycerol-3-alpha-glucose alpha-1,2-galactosyltransferase
MSALSVHILMEPAFVAQATGIATAVRQLQQAIAGRADVRLVDEGRELADIIHAHTVGPAYLLASWRNSNRLVVSAHVTPGTCLGGIHLGRLCYYFSRLYMRLAYNRARLVIAVSPAVKEELRAIGVRREIAILENSVDRDFFRRGLRDRVSNRQALGYSAKEFVVLGVGQVQPRKGVRTFARLAEELPEYRFLWVGGRPFGRVTADYVSLTRLMEQPPPNLTFAGMVDLDEMPRFYGLADAFVFPSHQETFGYAALEAAAAGLPLVLRDRPEFAGLFHKHYIPARDETEFANALRALHDDMNFYARWRNEATLLAGRFDLHNYMDRLVAIYRSIARQQPYWTAQAG